MLAKLLERCIKPLLQQQIEGSLSLFQSGFRPGHCTDDQVFRISRAVQQTRINRSTRPSLAKAHSILPIAFLDLSKAFDRVWVDGLLLKARNYGVCPQLWRWLRSFLTNRSIRVSCQGIISSPRAITAGVPQGSVLSGPLFLIFINDIVEKCVGCDVALYADDIAIWPHQPIYGNKQIGKIQLSNSLRGLSEWAADWRMLFNVKKSCVVLFRNSTRKQNDDSTVSNLSFSISGQQLPIESSARYLGVMLHCHGHWNSHFDFILPKVRYAVNRICRIIHKGQHPTLPVICELIKTQVHPIIAYGFPMIRYNESQTKKLNSLILIPIKRSLSAFATTSHASLFLTSKLLDVQSLWKKKAISYAHRLHRQPRSTPTAQLFRDDLRQSDRGFIPPTAPEYTLSFASKLREVEEQLHLHHDSHLPSQDLKRAAALDMITRMLAKQSQSPFLHNFDPDIDHPTHLDHHLRSDPPPVIALRSRLRLDCTRLNAPLHKRRMVPSPACPHCGRPETIIHVLLQCRQYAQARDRFIDGLGHKPPDDEIIEICLGRTLDRTKKGRRQTRDERISGQFLLDIDQLRPGL